MSLTTIVLMVSECIGSYNWHTVWKSRKALLLVTKVEGGSRKETQCSSSLPSVSSMTGGMMERRVSQLVCIAGLMLTSISHTCSERHSG